MGKYEPLRKFLERQTTSEVRMTFAEIEKVIGSALPEKSKNHRPWWSNNPNNNVMTKEWLAAGFRTEQVEVAQARLVFRRLGRAEAILHPGEENGDVDVTSRRRRHPAFGALKDVTWIAPDIDLTEPADPEWADLIESPDWHP